MRLRVWQRNAETISSVELEEGQGRLVIGSSEDADLMVTGDGVEGEHCAFVCNGGRVVVVGGAEGFQIARNQQVTPISRGEQMELLCDDLLIIGDAIRFRLTRREEGEDEVVLTRHTWKNTVLNSMPHKCSPTTCHAEAVKKWSNSLKHRSINFAAKLASYDDDGKADPDPPSVPVPAPLPSPPPCESRKRSLSPPPQPTPPPVRYRHNLFVLHPELPCPKTSRPNTALPSFIL
eukprot:TRINITY_DN12390_c0_g2_i1.p1 TRINITY_DN12390_c0_g2~~TRINITY_DN12390_c0_g2_i1.p1  ORF type:complete len:274 (+),score=56.09 TRINITY_DN12390_c0_g2_i1:122-823(+)